VREGEREGEKERWREGRKEGGRGRVGNSVVDCHVLSGANRKLRSAGRRGVEGEGGREGSKG